MCAVDSAASQSSTRVRLSSRRHRRTRRASAASHRYYRRTEYITVQKKKKKIFQYNSNRVFVLTRGCKSNASDKTDAI